MVRKKSFFFFIYIMLSFTLSQAYTISIENIPKEAIFVQAGAFKRAKAVKKIEKKLQSFAVVIQKNGDLTRIYAVASKKEITKKAFLKKIRKIIPDAFVKKSVDLADFFISQNFLYDDNLTNSLNSKTILRTRKKFF